MSVRGKNISLFLIDGEPSGRIKCTLANWTGVAYKIPRTELERCKDRDDLSQSGVYFLFGTSEHSGENVVYIGQAGTRKNGEGILYRLQEHKRNPNKDYWTEAIVFTTSNNSFGQTEISYLEHCFCALANEAKRYIVKNATDPMPGNLTEEKECELEEFIDYARIIMGALGHKVFEKLTASVTIRPVLQEQIESEEVLFYLERRDWNGAKSTGKRANDGFVVLAGSNIQSDVADYLSPGYKALRERYASSISGTGILQEDILFASPSAAASFVTGRSRNGLTEWKTKDGKSLKEIEQDETNQIHSVNDSINC